MFANKKEGIRLSGWDNSNASLKGNFCIDDWGIVTWAQPDAIVKVGERGGAAWYSREYATDDSGGRTPTTGE